jgi:predicted transcriptional regulator of viral defense system
MSNLEKLRRSNGVFFTKEDIRRILALSSEAATVFCARAVKRKDLNRIKRGVYLIPGSEKGLAKNESFKLASYLITPSYISLQTALSYYEISTQITAYTIESLCLSQKSLCEAGELRYVYWQTRKEYFFGFQKMGDFFIADPEKAIIDIANLVAYNRYAVDLSAISFNKLDWDKITKWSKIYSSRTKELLQTWRKKYA